MFIDVLFINQIQFVSKRIQTLSQTSKKIRSFGRVMLHLVLPCVKECYSQYLHRPQIQTDQSETSPGEIWYENIY
jgi:hypothetical protein